MEFEGREGKLDLFIGFYVLILCFSVLVIPMCGRQSWPALWSTFGCTI